MRATHIIWRGAGSNRPCEGNGDPIPERGSGAPCACCAAPGTYRLRDAISDNFTTVKNASRGWPFGGQDMCAACVFACKTLALRLAMSFSREDGVWFVGTRPIPGMPWTRPDALEAILHPPEPPFVALWPAYGIDHGGEANLDRAWWPTSPIHPDPLIRLQSKHVAIYARVATSRDRYPIQLDDNHDVLVDVALWSRLRDVCGQILAELRAAGVGARDATTALVSLIPPPGAPPRMLVHWASLVSPLRPHHGASWWPHFIGLLHMPPLTKKDRHATPHERTRPVSLPEDRHDHATPHVLSTSGDPTSRVGRRDRKGPVQGALF